MLKIREVDRSTRKLKISQIADGIEKETIRFDLAVQRGPCWSKQQKSALVQSILIDFPIPPCYCVTYTDDKDSYFFDGQQRCLALYEFYRDKFALSGIEPYEDTKGNVFDLEGLKFSELDVSIQAKLEAFKLEVNTFKDLDDDRVADAFYRLNNGKAMSSFDRMISKAVALPEIMEVAKHPIFKEGLSKRRLTAKGEREIVAKSMMVLYEDNPSLDQKPLGKFLKQKTLTEENIAEMNKIYDKILEIANMIREDDTDRFNVKPTIIYKRVLSKLNLISLCPFVRDHYDDKRLGNFIMEFFSGEDRGTISREYNAACDSGTGHAENVKKRADALKSAWKANIKE